MAHPVHHVQIYHLGVWGGICDDEWDRDEAEVVCRMLGYPGTLAAMHGSRWAYRVMCCLEHVKSCIEKLVVFWIICCRDGMWDGRL